MTDRKPLRRTIRGGRPVFFQDPAIDKVLAMVVTLGSEFWALRERVLAMEALHVRQGSLGTGDVDAFEFPPEQEEKLAAERREFIENLFRVLQEQAGGAADKAPAARKPPARKARAAVKSRSKTKRRR